MPTEPPTSHALHAPVQAELQHTPSTQKPEAHRPEAEHAVPFASRSTHRPAWQERPDAHCSSDEQDAGHEVPLPLHT